MDRSIYELMKVGVDGECVGGVVSVSFVCRSVEKWLEVWKICL